MSDNKKAFNTAHTSVPVYYPDELCLIGGADLLEGDQRGPLDTKAPKDGNDDLFRPNRLKLAFKVGFVESIDADGVMEDISIILREGVPVVEYGQMRTRAARVVNHARKKKCGCGSLSDRKAAERCAGAGYPLVALRCSGRKARSRELTLGRISAENNLRHDDDVETTLAIMTRFLDATENNVELVARQMGVVPQTVRHLMNFNDHATKETRKAVQAGKIGITAAALLAREKDPAAQNKLLATFLAAPDQTVRRAAQISGRKRGQQSATMAPVFTGKRALVKFKGFLADQAPADAFYDGVRALLDLLAEGKTADPRLAAIVAQYAGVPAEADKITEANPNA